jgi:hypothetical protein
VTHIASFQVGTMYSNEEVFKSLGVGNAGGIRIKTRDDGSPRRMVIMTSLPDAKSLVENPYHDRVEGNILVYTASGRVGNQTIAGQNAKIPCQVLEQFPIWAFQLQSSRRDRTIGHRRWKFLGLLEYLRSYVETQCDSAGTPRLVYVFEFYVHNGIEEVAVDLDIRMMATLIAESAAESCVEDSDREVELTEPPRVGPQPIDPAKLEEIRRRLLAQDPKTFETILGELLARTGFRDVEVTKYSQDGGIDLNARPGHSSWPLRHLLVQFQAKRWMHTVGRREVAELRGSILPHSVACIVTTSHFSRAAIAESIGSGRVPVSLINGHELAMLIDTSGLTV